MMVERSLRSILVSRRIRYLPFRVRRRDHLEKVGSMTDNLPTELANAHRVIRDAYGIARRMRFVVVELSDLEFRENATIETADLANRLWETTQNADNGAAAAYERVRLQLLANVVGENCPHATALVYAVSMFAAVACGSNHPHPPFTKELVAKYWLEISTAVKAIPDESDDRRIRQMEIQFAKASMARLSGPATANGRIENPNEMISGPTLAQRYNVDPEKLRKRLDYFRQKNPGSKDWTEIENRSVNEPKFIFRLGAVLAIVHDLPQKSDA